MMTTIGYYNFQSLPIQTYKDPVSINDNLYTKYFSDHKNPSSEKICKRHRYPIDSDHLVGHSVTIPNIVLPDPTKPTTDSHGANASLFGFDIQYRYPTGTVYMVLCTPLISTGW